jgi:hypothetical protein
MKKMELIVLERIRKKLFAHFDLKVLTNQKRRRSYAGLCVSPNFHRTHSLFNIKLEDVDISLSSNLLPNIFQCL